MKLVKVKQEFFDLCEKNEVANQLMKTKDGRPSVLVVKLKYRGKEHDFVVPLRSNIPGKAEEWEYMKLPPNKNTKSGFRHGIHYIRIFPIKKKYLDRYNIDQSDYLLTVKSIIDKGTKEIVDACQNYLLDYEQGNRHRFSVDLDAIIWYVESHLKCETLEYKELESQIGFSYAYIRELFQHNTGCSLAKYIRIRKMWLSAFDLLHTEKKILEIALEYGFSSQESYTRSFEKVTGLTPGRFCKDKPVIGKKELAVGVFSIGFLGKKEKRSDMVMKKEKYESNESTVLFGVPQVKYGAYGGQTPYPICLKACSDYLGEDVEYFYSMVTSAAAFRFAWNETNWDMSNVDIYHTFDESNTIYQVGAMALGREFEMLERDENTKKQDFIQFIKKHIDEGYPCIALGIIGPPEACLITGYRENGDVLLGWNFFQNDPDFASNVKTDESGYFVCDNWWENSDTQAVMCMGPIEKSTISRDEILKNAIRALTGRREHHYCKGVMAYQAWENMLMDESEFCVGNNFSVLFEKLLCQNDAITCLRDGRGQAANYFRDLALQENDSSKKEQWNQLVNLFTQTESAMEKMRELFGDWSQVNKMLQNLADRDIRKDACRYIRIAYEADKRALEIITGIVNN